jgi:hypothetical protein
MMHVRCAEQEGHQQGDISGACPSCACGGCGQRPCGAAVSGEHSTLLFLGAGLGLPVLGSRF